MSVKTSKELGRQAWRAFHRIRIVLLPPLIRNLSENCEMSEAEYQVFIGLSASKNGQMTPSQLADELGWDLGRLSHQVSRMEAKGLVAKQQCPNDARSCWVGPTSKGQKLFAKALPIQTKEVQRLFADALTPEQMQSLIEISEAIEANVLKHSRKLAE